MNTLIHSYITPTLPLKQATGTNIPAHILETFKIEQENVNTMENIQMMFEN